MAKLVNRAKMTTATTGTGTITLGSAVDSYQTFADAGVVDTDVVRYVIEDGSNWEIGEGTYTASGTTLSRTPSESSNSDAAISLSGSAVVFVGAAEEDLIQPGDDISELNNDSGFTTNTGTVTSINLTAGTGINVSGGPVTSSGSITVTNAAPDQTVVLTEGSNVTITGTYPSFTIASTDTNTTYTAGTGLDLTGTAFSIDSSVVTLTGSQTLTNKVLTTPSISTPTMTGTIVEDVFALSGTSVALEPDNGSVQTHTLSGNTTYTDGFSAGQAITLMVDDGSSRTITWPTITWVNNGGSAPTLATTGYTVIALWKVGSTLYGALVGDGS